MRGYGGVEVFTVKQKNGWAGLIARSKTDSQQFTLILRLPVFAGWLILRFPLCTL